MSDIQERCRGRWTDLLSACGVESRYLQNRHGPCPICMAGKDRFRYDNKDGKGTYFCSQCGSGDGFKFLMELKGWDFKETVKELEKFVGSAKYEKPRKPMQSDKLKSVMNDLWSGSEPITPGDPVDKYLQARGVGLSEYPSSLRYRARCSYQHEGNRITTHPAMIALVTQPNGKGATLHRTYLDHGGGKADLESPRRVMPGTIEKGSAIRLGGCGEILGIAEGIETALSAAKIYQIPVWAALNANMLMQFTPPEGVQALHIFGDNDASYAGQSAAYALAHKLSVKGLQVKVDLPDEVGDDWNDFLLRNYTTT